MNQEEIQKICIEKNVLLEDSLIKNLSSLEDPLLFGFLLDKLKSLSGKKFITNNLFEKNEKIIKKFFGKLALKKGVNEIEFYKF